MNPSLRSPLRTFAIAGLMIAVLAGCAGGSGPAGEATATERPAATRAEATSTPTPRPTATPDPAAELAERLDRLPDWIRATFEGTMTVAAEEVPVSGTYASSDRHFRVKFEYAGSSTAEQIGYGRANFVRADDGLWTRTDDPPDAVAAGVTRLLAGASVFRLLPASEGSRSGARYEAVGVDLPALTTRLGLLDRNGDLASGGVELLVDRDGDPVGMAVAATITQSVGDTTLTTEWDLEYAFDSIGKAVRIERPDEAWRLHTDADYGYLMFYPESWTYQEVTDSGPAFHVFFAPDGNEIQVRRYTEMAGATAEGWFAESAAVLERNFGSRPQETSIIVGGQPARLYELEAIDHGQRYLFMEATVFGEAVAWDIDWWSSVGNEEADRGVFATALGTFVPLR